jgi:hypothetical protein
VVADSRLQGNSTLTNAVDVKDSDASSGNKVYALGSVNSGNNLNWDFGNGPWRFARE